MVFVWTGLAHSTDPPAQDPTLSMQEESCTPRAEFRMGLFLVLPRQRHQGRTRSPPAADIKTRNLGTLQLAHPPERIGACSQQQLQMHMCKCQGAMLLLHKPPRQRPNQHTSALELATGARKYARSDLITNTKNRQEAGAQRTTHIGTGLGHGKCDGLHLQHGLAAGGAQRCCCRASRGLRS